MLRRRICQEILRSMSVPTRWCRARASEWSYFGILRKFGHPIPDTAPDIAGGLRVEENKLVFVDECRNARDGADARECGGIWVWEFWTGTKAAPGPTILGGVAAPMSECKGEQTLAEIPGYQTYWSHSFDGLFAIDFYSAGVPFRTDNLNGLLTG